MLQLFGESVESRSLCPGESNCDKFKSAKGRTRNEKERNACHFCDLFPTKTDRYKKSQAVLEALVLGAMEIRRRRNSGFPPKDWQILNLHAETLILIDALIETREIALKKQHLEYLKAGFNLQTR